MAPKLLLLTFLTLTLNLANAQNNRQQYFDGADTVATTSIFIVNDTGNSIWQIGPPQKTVFDSAATSPNVLVTDTINTYPKNDTSFFRFYAGTSGWGSGGVLAIRWKQKLDMDMGTDGGIIEYTTDTGKTWTNVFNDPKVYNFYGFDPPNADTLKDGTHAFTGQDSVWRDIWLCYNLPSVFGDTLIFRFTFRSDSVDSSRDGWMIDNMLIQETYYHTVSTVDPKGTFLVYPTITTGAVNVAMGDSKKPITNILVLDVQGRVVQRYNQKTEKTTIDLNGLTNGNYFIHVHTGEKIEVHKVLLNQ